ncbi:MAG: SDR family oxidoreductase [Roseovarius sp.]|nr:SDR family oxidoreductase [Roseovarius sp.]
MTDNRPLEPAPRIALVTGASRGLGAALGVALAPSHHVVAVARTTGALEALDDDIRAAGGTATLAPMDVTDPGAMAQLCRSIHDRWGRIDLWAHTAIHAAPLSPADHIDAKDWTKSLEINVTAAGRLIAFAAPLLTAESTALFFDDPKAGEKFFGAYGATKAAQIALARSWQAETARTGPGIHVLTPAPMPTATRARFFPGEDRAPLADPREEASRILAQL